MWGIKKIIYQNLGTKKYFWVLRTKKIYLPNSGTKIIIKPKKHFEL